MELDVLKRTNHTLQEFRTNIESKDDASIKAVNASLHDYANELKKLPESVDSVFRQDAEKTRKLINEFSSLKEKLKYASAQEIARFMTELANIQASIDNILMTPRKEADKVKSTYKSKGS